MRHAVPLPRGWAVVALDEVVAPRVEQRPPSHEVPYIDISSIDRQTKSIGELARVDEASAPTRARQWVRRGDVLVSMTRPNLNAVAIVPQKLDGAVASTGFDVLRAVGVLPEWIFNRARSQAFVADVCKNLQGVVYPAIRPRDVRAHQLPIPPLGEQHRIVQAIESYLTRLDNAVALLERVEENLKRYRASVLKAAVEGRLVPTEAELARREGRSYEHAADLLSRILAERKARWIEDAVDKARAKGVTDEAGLTQTRKQAERKYKEPEPPDTSDLPDLPEGWCWTTVDCLSSYVTSGSRGWAKYYSEAGAVFLRIGDLSRSSLTPEIGKAQRVELPSTVEGLRTSLIAGDIVISITADLGIIGVIPTNAGEAYVNQHIALVRPVEVSTSNYVGSYLTSELGQRELRRLDRGVTKAGLGLDDIRATRVAFPPADEMRRIVDQVERATSLVAANVEASKKIKRQVTSLRQSILKWAFEGKLVEQDPNDEPASALLARIQASGRRMSGRRRAR